MKKFIPFILILLSFFNFGFINNTDKKQSKPMLAIVIDDFGGYDESGLDSMLSINVPLTCAVMPNMENSLIHAEKAHLSNKEVILHMPMQASVNLPLNWYGPNYICNNESRESVFCKLDKAFDSIKYANGFNIHIGSGVCQQENVVNFIYDYAIEKNKFFLDSRTHGNTVCDKIANKRSVVYLGRDEFLEPKGHNSYETVKNHLLIAANTAIEKGYAIAIGHVGKHGGENTAKAIQDCLIAFKEMGIKIVPLSKIYKHLQNH